MNGRYQRRRERRAAEKYIYDEIDTWNLQKITAILSEAKKNKALAQRLIDYYLPILQALNSDTPYGLQHLQELPQYLSQIKNKATISEAQTRFYFKFIGFYFLKKKLAAVKKFIFDYPLKEINNIHYCDKDVDIILAGITLYDTLATQDDFLPRLTLDITQLSFYQSRPKKNNLPTFEGKIAAHHVYSLSSLSINNADQLCYFEPSQLVNLKYFYAKNISLQKIIPFLSRLPNIEDISLRETIDIIDLEHLACRSLKKLYIDIKYNYSSAQKMSDTVLDLPHLPNLDELSLNNCNIVSINKIGHLKKLTKLHLYRSNLNDITVLAQFPKLKEVYFNTVHLNDISIFGQKDSFQNMKILSVINNNIVDISPLSTLFALQYLNFSSNKIEDISPLSGLKNLRYVNLESNQISDINPLAGLNAELVVWAPKNKLDVCPSFELIRRVLAKDKNNQNDKQIYILRARQEPPHAPQIWQLLRSKDPANTELALQIAKGLGWTNDDIEPYTHIIKKWL
jgi:Leucine-rich repeat (LRR) protein